MTRGKGVGVVVDEQRVQQVYRFALRPSAEQRRALASHAGGARYAYNWGITVIREALAARRAEQDAKIAAHLVAHPDDDPDELRKTIKGDTPIPGHFDLCKLWTQYKNEHADTSEADRRRGVPYTGWVGKNASSMYQTALRNAHVAWSNTIKSATGRRAGRRVGAPRYKSRRQGASFTVNGSVTLPLQSRIQAVSRNQTSAYRAVQLPRIGTVPTGESVRKLARLLRKGDVDCGECGGRGFGADAPECKPCGGSGEREPVACGKCDGSGQATGSGGGAVDCRTCEGAGKRAVRCRTCKGHGRAKCGACLGEGSAPYCRIVSATCSQDPDGRWHVAIVVSRMRHIPTGPNRRQQRGGGVGIDIGTGGFTTSDGSVIEPPLALRRGLDEIRALSRQMSRAQKDSVRRRRLRLRLARVHGRVSNIRRDFNSKLATELIRGHSHIAVEGWSVADVIAKEDKDLPRALRAKRRRALLDVGAGQLRQMLTNRAPWYGATASFTSDYESTARTCSACGTVRAKPVPLSETMFKCEACGRETDRRHNSAVVTLVMTGAAGGADPKNARGGTISPRSPVAPGHGPLKREAPSDADPLPSGKGESRKRSASGSRGPLVQPSLWED